MWTSLPVWLRLCIAFALFGIGGLILWSCVHSGRRAGFRLGFLIIGVGFVALIFSTKDESEKKGYRF